jgi:hypothetical protein
MEAATFATSALSSLGYAWQSDYAPVGEAPERPAEDTPSMKDVYESSYWRTVRADEVARASRRWDASRTQANTEGIVLQRPFVNSFGSYEGGDEPDPTHVTTLAGQTIPVENFVHNNMEPFLRGSIKQSTRINANAAMLEKHTGRGGYYQPKREVEAFFEPSKNLEYNCGAPNTLEFQRNHIEAPIVRNNVFPIPQVRVGPGLNAGYTANPSGGFQQSDTLDYIRPKTIDELRPLTRQKDVYELGPQGPQAAPVTNRGVEGEMCKNRPETYFEQSPDQWLRTTGAVSRPTERPTELVRPTAKTETHSEVVGGAAIGAGQPGAGKSDDYGRSTIRVYTNARDLTQVRARSGNVTSAIKALTAPALDIFRRTPKEYFVESARTFGNLQAQMPEKATLYDPVNHVMRTTIKETLIHDTVVNNLKGPDAVPVTSDDAARTTNRETLGVHDTVRNVSAHTYRVVVIDPDIVAKTTVKETTSEAANAVGYVGGATTKRRGGYLVKRMRATPTQRQSTQKERFGGATSSSDFRARSRVAEKNMRANPTREFLWVQTGRTPTAQGAKVPLSKEGVQVQIQKLECDRRGPREAPSATRVYQTGAQRTEPCSVTKNPQKCSIEAVSDRLDTSVLSSLKGNPYNLSITPLK